MDLVFLGASGSTDVGLVGGKVAPLSKLAAHYRVPPGFCITTSAYAKWADPQMRACADTMRALEEMVRQAYDDLSALCQTASPPVAVRSSAADEDGHGASFAGQYETYLNRSGPDEVMDALLKCWDSATAERVTAYRQQHLTEAHEVRLAVLVQQLVIAASSGVVFSANPITGNRDEVVINACWGLGESVVSGTVTPDTYVVRKSDLSLVERRIARKERMTVAIPGGTEEVAVPRLLADQSALGDHQAIEMAQLALSLEAQFGYAVDLECAYQGGELYLLQCRPITTLG